MCGWPNRQTYRSEAIALRMGGAARSRTVVPCPVGHWHIVPRENPDVVVNPDPAPAENEIANTEER